MIADVKILGIDKQDTDDVSRDGTCASLRGLIPSGSPSNPQWRVNWMGEKIAVSIWTEGDQFINAHISGGVLFLWVKITGEVHELWKVTKATTTYDTKTKLLALSGATSEIWEAQFEENKNGFFFNVSGSKSRSYYYENGLLIPNALPLLGNNLHVAWNAKTLSRTSFDEQYGFYGDVPGMLRNKEKSYCFRFAYRLKNGQHAMHTNPVLVTVPEPDPRSDTQEYWADFSARKYNNFWYFPYTALTGTLQVGEVINNPSAAKGTGNATIRAISDKYILISDDYKAFASQESTITGQTSGATAKITSGAIQVWSDMLYDQDSQSYYDLLFDGLYTDPDNAIKFDPTNYTTARATVEMQPVTMALKELIDGVDLFMTLPYNSEEEAVTEGVYYFAGTIDESTNSVNVRVNEEKLASREILGQNAFTHHWLGGHSIGNFRERLVLGGVYNNFAIPLTNHVKNDVAGSLTGDLLAWVTIVKDNKEYYVGGRLQDAVAVTGTTPSRVVTLPNLISYPDRDAVKMELYWDNGTNYELANVYELKKHPGLNLAYSYAASVTYDEGDNQPNPSPGKTVEVFYEPEEFKVGDLQKAYWPLTQSYKVDSGNQIRGIRSNVDELTQGEFGWNPLYILCDKAIYTARLGEGVLFSRIDKIDQEHGIYNWKCHTSKGGFLWGAGNGRIWVLKGITVEQIQFPLLTNEENTDLLPIEAVGRMFSRESVIFAGAKEDFVYDIRYKTWYSYKPKGVDHSSNDISGRVFFEYAGQSYEMANLIPSEISQSDNSIINLDSTVKSSEKVNVLVRTNPIKLDDSTIYKRLQSSIIKGEWVIGNGDTLSVKAIGTRSTHNTDVELTTYSETDRTIANLVVRGYGSFQGFIFEISGDILGNTNSYLEHILINYIRKTSRPKI